MKHLKQFIKDEFPAIFNILKKTYKFFSKKKIVNYFGTNYSLTVSSGTAALEVALRALNLKGNEIITAASSCAATTNGILHAGFKPVFVDIDP